jgi:hypothetical protein
LAAIGGHCRPSVAIGGQWRLALLVPDRHVVVPELQFVEPGAHVQLLHNTKMDVDTHAMNARDERIAQITQFLLQKKGWQEKTRQAKHTHTKKS